MQNHRRLRIRLVALALTLAMLAGAAVPALAASSREIQKKINDLKTQEKAVEQQKAALESQLSANQSDVEALLAQKNALDQTIALTHDAIDIKNEQIQEYSLLIAERQNELDDALEARSILNTRYKARIRSMEENGRLTYWSILFKASSVPDLLDRIEMINEVAASDARMMDRLLATAQSVEKTRLALAAEKVALEEVRQNLDASQKELDEKRAASDELLSRLLQDRDRMAALEEEYDEKKETLLKQIAGEEYAYKQAVAKERASASSGSGSGASSYGVIWPTTSRSITCPFGPRIHPITHKYNNHSGMDIGANYGTPIVACKSGTVSKATYNDIFGYHVVINHGDGFSTLYGHMCRYTVRAGQKVTRGQVIGYVGTTGMSNGPHIHLTMYYNGSLVNPRKYLP